MASSDGRRPVSGFVLLQLTGAGGLLKPHWQIVVPPSGNVSYTNGIGIFLGEHIKLLGDIERADGRNTHLLRGQVRF